MGLGCNHDDRFINTADDGTAYCVFCLALAAEAERNAYRTLAAQLKIAHELTGPVPEEWSMERALEHVDQEAANAAGENDGNGL